MSTETQPNESGQLPHSAAVLPFPKMSRVDQVGSASTDDRSDDLRSVLGEVLRAERLEQDRTLAEVADDAHVSLAYLSEVERGLKDISSELLGAVIDTLDLPLATVLGRCIDLLPTVTATVTTSTIATTIEARSQRSFDAQLLAA